MEKKLIYLLLFCLILLNCEIKPKKNSINEIKSLKRVNIIKIPTSEVGVINFVAFDDSLSFYLSTAYSNKIYKCNVIHSKEKYVFDVKQISQNGKGPGEYIYPLNLYLYKNYLYIKDINQEPIECINIKSEEYFNSFGKVTNSKLVCAFRKIFLLNNDPPAGTDQNLNLLDVYDFKTGQLIKENHILSPQFSWIYNSPFSGGITYDTLNKNVYFARCFPYKIFKVDSNLNLQTSMNFEDNKNPDYISANKEIEKAKKILRKTRGKGAEYKNLVNNYHLINDLYMIYSKNKSYILSVLRKKTESDYEYLYQIINSKGHILESFFMQESEFRLLGVFNDNLYFFNTKEYNLNPEYNHISIYKFTEGNN